MRGTALVPYWERLSVDLQGEFLRRYADRLRTRWPESPVFFGFQRILFAASVVRPSRLQEADEHERSNG